MDELAELRQKVASCEQKIIQLEEDNRQVHDDIVALRSRGTQWRAALRAVVAGLRLPVSCLSTLLAQHMCSALIYRKDEDIEMDDGNEVSLHCAISSWSK